MTYYPEFGELLPDGRLRVKTSQRAADGEIQDGFVDIASDDPRYNAWVQRWRDRENYFKKSREEVSNRRRQRRSERAAHQDERAWKEPD